MRRALGWETRDGRRSFHVVVIGLLLAGFLALAMGPTRAQTAESAQAAPAEATLSLDGIKTALDEIEAALGREDAGADALGELRQNLNGAIDEIRGKIE